MDGFDVDQAGAEAMRTRIGGLSLNQSSFAGLLSALGDKREPKAILRSVQRMANSDSRVSGEMWVILKLLERDIARARRLAEAIPWECRADGSYLAEVQGVHLGVYPQSRGRWLIRAQHIANGYSPPIPHWRNSLEEAKVRAVLAVDETLDHIERIGPE
jgi:hypothetical protein